MVVEEQQYPNDIVYVTENSRDAEELAFELGYRLVIRKMIRPTPQGKATIREFVVVPNQKEA